jgi:2'-hydroxyisoflavone reductase
MPNRREFLTTIAIAGIAGGMRALGYTPPPPDIEDDSPSDSEPLRILILGDTGFIGQHHVGAALARGHKVSVFCKTPMVLPSAVEQLTGDRNGDLGSAQNRDWDAVIDTATYVPFRVRTLGLALKGRVKHYTFISSIDVYDHPGANATGTDEKSNIVEYKDAADPYSITQAEGKQYGPLGVLCEREAEKQFPGRTLIVRPGAVIGPGDPAGAFTYWPVRMEKGGEILAAGDPSVRVQMIDVRDMAYWVIRMAESTGTGTFNTVGPAFPMGWADMLGALRGRTSAPVTLTWVPDTWLQEQMVPPLSNLRFWSSEAAKPGSMHMNNSKALERGMTLRPLAQTATDTLVWYKQQLPHLQAQLLLGLTGMFSLRDSMELERQLLGAWHANETRKS